MSSSRGISNASQTRSSVNMVIGRRAPAISDTNSARLLILRLFHRTAERSGRPAYLKPPEQNAAKIAYGGRKTNTASRPLYTLPSICSAEYTKRVESVFEIIAEPNRRAIL